MVESKRQFHRGFLVWKKEVNCEASMVANFLLAEVLPEHPPRTFAEALHELIRGVIAGPGPLSIEKAGRAFGDLLREQDEALGF
jgi:hypothetical protein